MFYLFEAAVQVKLPPVQVIRVEGEVIVLSTVTGVGQHVPPAFGEAQEDVPVIAERRIRHSIHIAPPQIACSPHPALRNSSLTMVFSGTQTRGGSFRKSR